MRCRVLLSTLLVVTACARPARVPVTVADGSAATRANAGETRVGSTADATTTLVDVRALDSTIVVRLAYLTAANFTGAPLPGYRANRALLRREAAEALVRVQRRVRTHGLGLVVYDAYRPARATEAMVAWTVRAGRQDLVRDGYIASRSRHNLGVAIDLTLAQLASGMPLDMGTSFDTFSIDSHGANAVGAAAVNRQMLKSAMESEGFVAYEREWWHFSYPLADPLRFDIEIASSLALPSQHAPDSPGARSH